MGAVRINIEHRTLPTLYTQNVIASLELLHVLLVFAPPEKKRLIWKSLKVLAIIVSPSSWHITGSH